MKQQFFNVGVAALLVVIGGGLLIHALSSRQPARAERGWAQRLPDRERFQPQAPFPGGAEENPGRRPPQPPKDPLAQNLFPPELIMQSQSRIGLSDDQRQAVMAAMQKAQPTFEDLQQQLEKEVAALGPLLDKERVEAEPALAQSDKVQDLEREIRRTQLALLISLKNLLTPDQQAALREIMSQPGPGDVFAPGPPPGVPEAIEKLRAAIRQRKRNGQDPGPLAQALEKTESLIKAGRFQDAEAVLDDALGSLEEKKPR